MIVFFGLLFFALVVLILVYFCVRGGNCCWHQLNKQNSDLGEDILQLVGESDDYDDNSSFFNKPYLMTRPVYHNLKNEPDFDDQTPQFYEETLKSLRPHTKHVESVQSYGTGYTSPEEEPDECDAENTTDTLFIRKEKGGEHVSYVEGTRVRLSLLYSKSDFFLMLTINEVDGIPNKQDGGFDYVRVSVTLFPKKKYRSKTKYVFVKDSKANFDESFKFSNVTRESLFSSAFRIRLQGKKKIAKENCLGEVMVQLADVAQRAGGFLTWRTFGKIKRQ